MLKTLRQKQGLTREELAEKTGVNVRTIRAYETGTTNIDKAEMQNIGRLALFFNVPVSDFFKSDDLKNLCKKIRL